MICMRNRYERKYRNYVLMKNVKGGSRGIRWELMDDRQHTQGKI